MPSNINVRLFFFANMLRFTRVECRYSQSSFSLVFFLGGFLMKGKQLMLICNSIKAALPLGLATLLAVVVSLTSVPDVHAATIAVVPAPGVTDFFGNQNSVADSGDAAGLLFDEARTGGSDATNTAFNPARRLDGVSGTNSNWAAGLPTGTAGGTVDFTGFGFALPGSFNNTTNPATQVSLNIVYLGADGSVGGADDELVGSVTDNLNFTVAGEYGWSFDNPLQFSWDGLNNRFRFEISGNGDLRFKQRPATESPSDQGGLVLSVGGNFVPEPASSGLVLLGLIGAVALRRRS
jgi:hypothetical protein